MYVGKKCMSSVIIAGDILTHSSEQWVPGTHDKRQGELHDWSELGEEEENIFLCRTKLIPHLFSLQPSCMYSGW